MRLPGVWLYGALTIGLLATAGFIFEERNVTIFAIMSAGLAYAAEYVAQEIEWGRTYAGTAGSVQLSLVGGSVVCGCAAFLALVFY